jgi:hypothetical protein
MYRHMYRHHSSESVHCIILAQVHRGRSRKRTTPVVPAKAGTQWRSSHDRSVSKTLDPRLRADDPKSRRSRESGNQVAFVA